MRCRHTFRYSCERLKTHQIGFGLIEILIAMVLSLGVLGVILNIFVSTKQNHAMQENLGRLQENARATLAVIAEDIRLSGFSGETQQYWDIAQTNINPQKLATIAGECFSGLFRWAAPMIAVGTDSAPMLFGANNVTASVSDKSALSGCISDSNYKTNTDILSLHFVGPSSVVNADLEMGKVYLRSNLVSGKVFKCHNNGSCVAGDAPDHPGNEPTTANYQVNALAYYVRPWFTAAGDGIPTLVRAVLTNQDCNLAPTSSSAPCVRTEVVSEGVEAMQIRYGLDTDGDGDADRYVDANQVDNFSSFAGMQNWHNVRTVRVWLLLRSEEPEAGHIDSKTYAMGDTNVTPNNSYRHALVTITVAIRNSRG